MDYEGILVTPIGALGIRCIEQAVVGIALLPADTSLFAPRNALAHRVCAQLEAYFADACFHFDLPLRPAGTRHQQAVWRAISDIPCGQTRSYGEIAAQIGSSARAVGQACANNPIPIIVPCHRVVGSGGLGGFMHCAEGGALQTKRWLLEHERR